MNRIVRAIVLFSFGGLVLASACAKKADPNRIVVYAAIDRAIAEPVIAAFEKKTGARVDVIFDSEAAKTVALAERLMLEKDAPRADIWWSGESLFTARLIQAGVLVPDSLVRPTFRVRVIAARRTAASSAGLPHRSADLLAPRWKGRIAVARSTVGTTAGWMTHVAQNERGRAFLKAFAQAEPLFVGGNALAVEAVVRDDADVAITDVDDALAAAAEGADLLIVPLDDPSSEAVSHLALWSGAAVVRAAPHADLARRFAAFLLEKDEAPALTAGAWAWPADPAIPCDPRLPPLDRATLADPGDFGGAAAIEAARRFLDEVFERR